MPSLTCKGGVGEGFAVPGSKSVQADAKRYYPIVSASTNSPNLAANRQCLLPNPPYPPLHKGGMAGAHIDTRYIQTDKQQFTRKVQMSTTEKQILTSLSNPYLIQ